MKSDGPFGFTFLQIIAAVIIVGVAGIALINYLKYGDIPVFRCFARKQ